MEHKWDHENKNVFVAIDVDKEIFFEKIRAFGDLMRAERRGKLSVAVQYLCETFDEVELAYLTARIIADPMGAMSAMGVF